MLQSQLELIEADTAEERATSLLTNLGFSPELRARSMSALSGGWKVQHAHTRTALLPPTS